MNNSNRPTRLSIGRRNEPTGDLNVSKSDVIEPAKETISPTRATPAIRQAPVTPQQNVAANSSFDDLMKKYETLKNNRSKLEFQYEQAEKTISECEQIAKKMGISSLEELEEKIREIQQKETDDLKIFEENLAREIEAHNQIKINLNKIDNETELN